MTTTTKGAPAPTTADVERPTISILIHVTDPGARIPVLVKAYSQVLADMGRRGELVFVLDGVAGAPLEQLERFQAERDDVRVLTLLGRGHGESIAFKAALAYAQGDILVTAWDYLQVDPRELAPLLEALEQSDSDLVSSWRHPRVDPLLNRMQSSFFNWFLRLVSRVDLHDLNCNFRVMRRDVLNEVALYGDMFRFLPIMASRRGFKVQEVKVRHLEEKGKTGFFGLGVYLRRLLDILAVTFLTRFTRKPLRFFGIIGFALILLGLALALPPFFERLFGMGSIQQRPIVLVGVVLVSFGLQFVGFGLVGEIIIFTQSKNLKDYKVERVVTQAEIRAGSEGGSDVAPAALSSAILESAAIAVRRPSPGEEVVLDHYVERHERGTVFHLSSWRRMVSEVLKRDSQLLVAERAGEVVGFLPAFHVKSIFLGRVTISMPFAVYGGCIADDADIAQKLIERAASDADAAGSGYLELRHIRPWEIEVAGAELAGVDRYVTFLGDVPEDPGECLGKIPRKSRADARRGAKAGLQLVEALDVPLFTRLFAVNKQGLGSPPMPRAMVESIVRSLGKRAVMHQVRLEDGTPIAAVLSFLHGNTILPYYSGGLPGYSRLGVNNFMYWKLMEWASERGIARFDFGRSRRDSGAARFKKNMGFVAEPLAYQYHLGEGGKLPDFTPDNPKLGVYQKIWRGLPGPIVRTLGAQMFKQLP